MTCNFHKFGEYFPETGSQEDKEREGQGYAVSVPLKDGITAASFQSVFEPVSFFLPGLCPSYAYFHLSSLLAE